MRDGTTVTLPQAQLAKFERFGLSITTFVRSNGKIAYKLIDRLTGKLMGCSGKWHKIIGHAHYLCGKRGAA